MAEAAKILIVDDEPHVRELIAEEFEASTVMFAKNGKVALDIVKNDEGITMISTDLEMPHK